MNDPSLGDVAARVGPGVGDLLDVRGGHDVVRGGVDEEVRRRRGRCLGLDDVVEGVGVGGAAFNVVGVSPTCLLISLASSRYLGLESER